MQTRLVARAPDGASPVDKLAAVFVPAGRLLTTQPFHDLLADWVQDMIEGSGDRGEAVGLVCRMLEESGLGPEWSGDLDNAGQDLIGDNPAVMLHLRTFGLSLPEEAVWQDTPGAAELIWDADLWKWANQLLHAESDRA